MSRSSGRGQVEPLAALVAVAVACLALSLYAGVLDATLPGPTDRNLAESAVERVESTVAPTGVARPALLDEAQDAGPKGYTTNVTLSIEDDRWAAGPPLPQGADTETVRLGVRVGPAAVRTGRLRVGVWR